MHCFKHLLLRAGISLIAALPVISLLGCSDNHHVDPHPKSTAPVKIAFMPDIHFHDIYGEFEDGAFAGLPNSQSGNNATIRTMAAQLGSTRLFNENYFALLAALDDIVARDIKLVALPGDFSDDGQPLHIRGLKKILDEYADLHGLRFFATTGNHDPNRPHSQPAGKKDFLGLGGKEQRIISLGVAECEDVASGSALIDAGYERPTICSEDVSESGYAELMEALGTSGFYPQPSYIYWETPYVSYTQDNYNLAKANSAAELDARSYEVCHQGTGGSYKQPGYSNCFTIPDSSYLVEPQPGLWLLAIDANVFVPKAKRCSNLAKDSCNFNSASSAGYNKLMTHKTQLLDWIQSVVQRAKASNKQLVTFSHYPMTGFYEGQSNLIAKTFGNKGFQLSRVPLKAVRDILAETGVQLHVGGHMHFNDTGVIQTDTGHTLFNIQAPSLAAYVPAYKVLTLNSKTEVEVETVILDEIPRFNELFEHYEQEHEWLTETNRQNIWNKEILNSKNYREFTNWHIREITRLDFLPEEWPEDLRQLLLSMNGLEMLALSFLENDISMSSVKANRYQLSSIENSHIWRKAIFEAESIASSAGIKVSDLTQWSGLDLAVDFYRLRNADQLALRDINANRMDAYQLLGDRFRLVSSSEVPAGGLKELVRTQFSAVFSLLDTFAKAEASDHFLLKLDSGEVVDMSRKAF